jgi:hypothetical protein
MVYGFIGMVWAGTMVFISPLSSFFGGAFFNGV